MAKPKGGRKGSDRGSLSGGNPDPLAPYRPQHWRGDNHAGLSGWFGAVAAWYPLASVGARSAGTTVMGDFRANMIDLLADSRHAAGRPAPRKEGLSARQGTGSVGFT